jgi:hypothetical protein
MGDIVQSSCSDDIEKSTGSICYTSLEDDLAFPVSYLLCCIVWSVWRTGISLLNKFEHLTLYNMIDCLIVHYGIRFIVRSRVIDPLRVQT